MFFIRYRPLRTGQEVDFKTIPICIEANSEEGLGLLLKLGAALSKKVQVIPFKKRKVLHAAAVFANNFPNYLYTIAKEICDDNQLDFDLLKPLIAETTSKIKFLDPTRSADRTCTERRSKNHARTLKSAQRGKA